MFSKIVSEIKVNAKFQILIFLTKQFILSFITITFFYFNVTKPFFYSKNEIVNAKF